MSQKIAELFGDNFNTIIPQSSKLKPGLVPIVLKFKVNKQGKVIDINAKAEEQFLIKEAQRVAKLIPHLKPGLQRGKPVIVPFTLPLKINLELSRMNEIKTYPMYRGCDKDLNYVDMKKCTTEKIVDYIKVSFDYQNGRPRISYC